MRIHTPEPWHVRGNYEEEGFEQPECLAAVSIAGPQPDHDFEIAHLVGHPHPAVNARRICAAVNACVGIETDRLEKMVPGTLANLLTLKGGK